jgi:hypothetical protein
MKSYLVDVNVWVALASDRHVHYEAAHRWFGNTDAESAAFCRLTQLGFLRLITNPRVMGDDVLTQREAWRVYDRLCEDIRVTFVSEPPDVEVTLRELTQSAQSGATVWTDAYLAAVARARGLTVVSFDRGFRRLCGAGALILPGPLQ